MNARYRVLPKADRDLDAHAGYLAEQANLEIARRFLSSAHSAFEMLGAQPNMGWRSRLRLSAAGPIRIFRVPGFETTLILYRSFPEVVEILRLIHGSRNIRALLRREGIE